MKSSVECYHIIFVCLSVLNRDLHLCFGISEVRSSCSTGITIGDMEKIVWSHLMLDRAPHDIIPKSSYPGIKSSLIIVLKLSFEVEREREGSQKKIQTWNKYQTNRLTEPIIVCISIGL